MCSSLTQAELQAALPAASESSALKNNPAVAELKKYMSEVEAIKNEREVIESELNNAKCDMGKPTAKCHCISTILLCFYVLFNVLF